MALFKSWQSFWQFEHAVKNKSRYIRDKVQDDFLKTVLTTSKDRIKSIPGGGILWRSQLGHGSEPIYDRDEHIDDTPGPLPSERMKPKPGTAAEGRANPKGIPYLYLATDKETAMSEVRPWVGSYVSVGQFKIVRDLSLIDCSLRHQNSLIYFEEPNAEERERAVWSHIDHAFSRPVNSSDRTAEYVPTQIITELFKNEGFDGIGYKSALGKGLNIVLFDLDAAELINCFLYIVKDISFDFQQAASPYFIRKHYENEDSG